MKLSRFFKNLMLLGSMTVLASCNIFNLIPPPSQTTTGNSQGGGDIPDISKSSILPFTLRDMNLTTHTDVLPSQGKLNLLLLPIEFTDCPFAPQTIKDLEVAVNGTPEETGYWESVSSFYKKTSFGKSELHYEVADVYKTGKTQRQVFDEAFALGGGQHDNGSGVIRDAYLDYIRKNGNSSTKQFDSDHNGWIDGVVAIYSGNNLTQMANRYDTQETMFYWAYTYWTIGSYPDANWNKPNPNCPTPNLYVWMSYDFFYEAVDSPKVDAHTLIHETGHMYGLDDYYAANSCMAGGHAMMDANVVDHDAYSKMMLGWVEPHVVKNPETITFEPSQNNGDCILIPGSEWNGTAYDEYFLLELYTPTGLNALDSQTAYPGHQLAYTKPGIKLYHVDSRVMEITQDKYGRQSTKYMKDPASGLKKNSTTAAYGYVVAASNCYKQYWTDSEYDARFSLLHMIEADNRFDFARGRVGTNADLFTRGTFSMRDFPSFFLKRDSMRLPTMNNGDFLPYRISFDEITDTSATLTFSNLF